MKAAREFREARVTRSLVLASRHWRRLAGVTAKDHGLSEATLAPLITLARMEGEVRQNALADAVGIEGPSLVRLIDQLEAAGLLRRVTDRSDRRARILALTEAGRAKVREIDDGLGSVRARTLAGISDAELEAALRVFSEIERTARDAEAAP